jgi:hypothetical protein
MVRQYAHGFFLLPLWEKVARTTSAPDEGSLAAETNPSPVCNASHRSHPLPQGERGKKTAYADAVVTPPSTTIVWPVMKLDASEPR